METFVTIIHYIVSIFMIFVILLQAGKSAGMGGGLGGAATQITSSAKPTLLSRLTMFAALIFVITSFTLSRFSTPDDSSVMSALEVPAEVAGDVAPTEEVAATDAPAADAPAEGPAAEAAAAPEVEPAPEAAPAPEEAAPAVE